MQWLEGPDPPVHSVIMKDGHPVQIESRWAVSFQPPEQNHCGG
jgi:hypothetical protein